MKLTKNLLKYSFCESVYMRKLPQQLTSFSSDKGKKIFQQAQADGTMECYFPLAEQFLTQYKPSTCGATSLVMVLNALKVDPLTKWDGIWRWYSEENLNGLKSEHLAQGINLSDLSHIARHNRVAIQTFYHPNQLALVSENAKQVKIKPQFHDCLDECVKDDHGILIMSYETFKICMEVSTRRSGFYIIVNTSRQALGQTGIGHFCPVGGYHQVNDMALLMDVARYKYPPWWCNLPQLYDSFAPIDPDTKMTRGLCLVTRSIQYPHMCRISQDLIQTSKIQNWLKQNPNLNDPLPKEVILQSVIYLFDFLERQAYREFDESYQTLLTYSIISKEQLFQNIERQRGLFNLLNDFSFRDENLRTYLGILVYNYFFNKQLNQLPAFLKKEFFHMNQSFDLNSL